MSGARVAAGGATVTARARAERGGRARPHRAHCEAQPGGERARRPEADGRHQHEPGRRALSLLSKVWGMTLPLVLVVLDAWPLDRLRRDGRRVAPVRSLVVEKIPHTVLGLAAAGAALIAQGTSGAMVGLATLSPVQRVMQMAYGLCFYVRKTVLPLGLSPVYLLDWELDPLRPVYLASATIVLLVAALLVALRRHWPASVVAFLCYAIVVSASARGDPERPPDRRRPVHVPSCIPFALLAGAGLGALPPGSVPGRVAAAVAALVLAVLGTLTWRQTHVWHDSERLWTRAVANAPYPATQNPPSCRSPLRHRRPGSGRRR